MDKPKGGESEFFQKMKFAFGTMEEFIQFEKDFYSQREEINRLKIKEVKLSVLKEALEKMDAEKKRKFELTREEDKKQIKDLNQELDILRDWRKQVEPSHEECEIFKEALKKECSKLKETLSKVEEDNKVLDLRIEESMKQIVDLEEQFRKLNNTGALKERKEDEESSSIEGMTEIKEEKKALELQVEEDKKQIVFLKEKLLISEGKALNFQDECSVLKKQLKVWNGFGGKMLKMKEEKNRLEALLEEQKKGKDSMEETLQNWKQHFQASILDEFDVFKERIIAYSFKSKDNMANDKMEDVAKIKGNSFVKPKQLILKRFCGQMDEEEGTSSKQSIEYPCSSSGSSSSSSSSNSSASKLMFGDVPSQNGRIPLGKRKRISSKKYDENSDYVSYSFPRKPRIIKRQNIKKLKPTAPFVCSYPACNGTQSNGFDQEEDLLEHKYWVHDQLGHQVIII